METKQEQPKVRVVKAGGKRLRSGMIRVDDEKGTRYRGPCDRCRIIVTTGITPLTGRELLCRDCVYVARMGKPSTKVKRKGEVVRYITECDLCGDRDKTSFLPKKIRPFLCGLCRKEEQPTLAKGNEKNDETTVRAQAAPVAKADEQSDRTATRTQVEPSKQEPTPDQTKQEEHRIYTLTCKRCRCRVEQKFRPGPGETFVCPNCYHREQEAARKRGEHPGTRLIFNMECVVCGKTETVNFVPKSLSEPICTECFDKLRRK